MKKIVLLTFVLTCFLGCFEEPPNSILLSVPYYSWLCEGYCAMACIQMWAAYTGRSVQQDEIASTIGGAWPSPDQVVTGVNIFTNSIGWLEFESAYNPYHQDVCIAYSIASIQDSCPSIMPFYGGMDSHGILAIGFQWHEDGIGTPIADFMTYHDPNPNYGNNIEITGATLKQYFLPCNGYYFVIVGRRFYINLGLEGYNAFSAAGGTYYGAGPDYEPPVL
jgi:hypothetical protein